MEQVVTVAGVALAAVLAYIFGVRRDRDAALHQSKVAAVTDFCQALMEYSGAQLRRRTEEIESGLEKGESLSEAVLAVRRSRTAAWAAYFHVLLVIDDAKAAELGLDALNKAVEIRRVSKGAPDAVALADAKRTAAEVRRDAGLFVLRVAETLGLETIDQPSLVKATTDASGSSSSRGERQAGRPLCTSPPLAAVRGSRAPDLTPVPCPLAPLPGRGR